MYPMWMCKRSYITVTVLKYIKGGGGGGGMTVGYRDKPFPTVRVKKVISMDDYDNINIRIVKIVDLSLSGGGDVNI